MCDKAILESDGTLKSAPDYYKNQQMCNKAVDNYPFALKFVVKCYKICVIKLLILILVKLNIFLFDLRPEKCVIKPFTNALFYLILFLINMLTKCVIESFLMIVFQVKILSW